MQCAYNIIHDIDLKVSIRYILSRGCNINDILSSMDLDTSKKCISRFKDESKLSDEDKNNRQLYQLYKDIMSIKILSSQMNIDGSKNLWIVKPKNLSCGKGIYIYIYIYITTILVSYI